ncbi:MAG: helix-turn-helix domain-containing protein [Planctomycetota bacterium]
MKSIDKLAEELRQARRAASMKQTDLARQLDVSQAAVSQFERGNASALSFPKIQLAAAILGVELNGPAEAAPTGQILKYCEHPDCLANVTFQGHHRLIVRPRLSRAPAESPTFCPECGELLMDHCPNEECGRPVQEGSFCTDCGTAYVALGGALPRQEGRPGQTLSEEDLDRILRHTRVRP